MYAFSTLARIYKLHYVRFWFQWGLSLVAGLNAFANVWSDSAEYVTFVKPFKRFRFAMMRM